MELTAAEEPFSADLESLGSAIQAQQLGILRSPDLRRRAPRFVPHVPKTLADTGLPESVIEQLILKLLYYRGDTRAGDLARRCGLQFALIEPVIDGYKHQRMLQVKGSSGFGPVSATLSLTEAGRKVAREYLEINQYAGPAPVPVAQYVESVIAQRMPEHWLTPERLATAYAHMVLKSEVLDQLGPAVNAGRSLLIYGQPGDGKTHLAEAIFQIAASHVFLPFALESQGNIIQLYDPLCHRRAEPEAASDDALSLELKYDGRWAHCRRPFVVTGGELSLSMLDLSYNRVSKIYDAPYQLKANNGSYLIDDFGRQRATPTEILNRWILPMEHRIDYLSFLNGGKVSVPFETFLMFSTNLTPTEIGDEAFLRRIQYKLPLPGPEEQEFRAIFCRFCDSQALPVDAGVLDAFVDERYRRLRKPFRRCHPRDLVTRAIDFIRFKGLPYRLTAEVLDRAFTSCFGTAA